MRRRNDRPPSEAELVLWAEVARSIRPFAGKSSRSGPLAFDRALLQAEFAASLAEGENPPEVPVPYPEQPQRAALKDGYATIGSQRSREPAARPAAGPLDRRLLIALKRGHQPIESVIDLHGMRQDEALIALTGFLHRASSRGIAIVLVVTGKGGTGSSRGNPSQARHDAGLHERGVLRRMVPHWLRLPDLSPLVSGFEQAHARHGGSGALYIRLRRGAGRAGMP